MSKAEKFISDCTRNCSNEYLTDSKPDGLGGYISRRKFTPWLTPDQARKAVEIAREEIIEWLEKNAFKYIEKQNTMFGTIKVLNSYKLVNDLKKYYRHE